MIDREFLTNLRQGTLVELQAALERMHQAKGAIAMIDSLLAHLDEPEKAEKVGGTD